MGGCANYMPWIIYCSVLRTDWKCSQTNKRDVDKHIHAAEWQRNNNYEHFLNQFQNLNTHTSCIHAADLQSSNNYEHFLNQFQNLNTHTTATSYFLFNSQTITWKLPSVGKHLVICTLLLESIHAPLLVAIILAASE